MANPLGGAPVETIFVELIARADKLIEEAKRARAEATKTMEAGEKEIAAAWKELEKAAGEYYQGVEKGAEESTKKASSAFTKLGNVIANALGIAGGLTLFDVLKKVGSAVLGTAQQAIGLNASMESVNITFERLLGSEAKAQQFMEAMKIEAAKTGQNVAEMALAAKQFLPYAEGSEEAFMNMIRAQQALAAADPIQGMMGAAYAMREFLSGSYTSLAMRFELPKKKLAEITKMQGTMEDKMAALNQLLEQYGMGWGLVEAQLDTFSGRMGFLRGVWTEVVMEFGKPIFQEANSALAEFAQYVKDNKEEILELVRVAGEFVATLADGLLNKVIPAIISAADRLDAFYTKLNRGNEEWGAAAINTLKQIGFIITSQLLGQIASIWLTFATVWHNIQVTIAKQGLALEERRGMEVSPERWAAAGEIIPMEELSKGLDKVVADTKKKVYDMFKFEKEAKEEVTKKAEEVSPEEEVEKAPPGLDEKAQKAALKGAKKIEDIIKDFQKRVEKLARDHGRKLADISEKANKDRIKAIEKANKAEADETEDYQKDIAQIREEYNREKVEEQKDFNREWKRLIRDQHQEVLDAEWEFQFEEERLIAEGDTLALRELRLRYAHEKDVRAREQEDARSDMQDDREEQKSDRERAFREELDDRESQFRERMADIQTQLQEQMATIAENEAESRAKEQESYAERYADLVASRDEKLQAVGEGLMSEKDMNLTTAQAIMDIWAKVYGPEYMEQVQKGIDADQARRESLGLLEQQAMETAAALQAAAEAEEGADPWSVAAARARQHGTTSRPSRSRTTIGGEMEFAQHGLDAVFSRPTPIMVGEGGVAEHVRVTPLGGGAGGRRVEVDLSGNINVTGSALSPEAANMLIVQLSEAVVEGISRRPE